MGFLTQPKEKDTSIKYFIFTTFFLVYHLTNALVITYFFIWLYYLLSNLPHFVVGTENIFRDCFCCCRFQQQINAIT